MTPVRSASKVVFRDASLRRGGSSNALGPLSDNVGSVITASNALGPLSNSGIPTTASNALGPLSNSSISTTASNALGPLAVAERDIRALRTARADSARSGD